MGRLAYVRASTLGAVWLLSVSAPAAFAQGAPDRGATTPVELKSLDQICSKVMKAKIDCGAAVKELEKGKGFLNSNIQNYNKALELHSDASLAVKRCFDALASKVKSPVESYLSKAGSQMKQSNGKFTAQGDSYANNNQVAQISPQAKAGIDLAIGAYVDFAKCWRLADVGEMMLKRTAEASATCYQAEGSFRKEKEQNGMKILQLLSKARTIAESKVQSVAPSKKSCEAGMPAAKTVVAKHGDSKSRAEFLAMVNANGGMDATTYYTMAAASEIGRGFTAGAGSMDRLSKTGSGGYRPDSAANSRSIDLEDAKPDPKWIIKPMNGRKLAGDEDYEQVSVPIVPIEVTPQVPAYKDAVRAVTAQKAVDDLLGPRRSK